MIHSQLLPVLASLAGLFGPPEATLRYQAIPLPGPPAVIVPADVDGDGRPDLAVVVAVTRWDQISVEESAKMDDVQGLVETLTVIPALVERRELRVFLGRPGGYAPEPLVLALDPSILSIEAGPPGAPLVALTDDGLSALKLQAGVLSWVPLLTERSVLSGTGAFVPNLGLVHDLDGDGRADILIPTREGATIYLSGPDGLRREPASRVRFPLDDLQPAAGERLSRLYPLPEVADVDGDKLPDLILRNPRHGLRGFRVLRNLGGGKFAEAVAPLGPAPLPGTLGISPPRKPGTPAPPVPVWFGDLDGDGRAEYVTQQQQALPEGAGLRKEMAAAKRPHFVIRLHHARPDLSMDPTPYRELQVEGYAFDDDGGGGGEGDGDDHGFRFPGGLQDLNGDGRLDLVALTADFSLFQALKVLTVQRLSVELDFHVWCQTADGNFTAVRGLDLSGTLNLDLRNVRPGQLSQFSGDFDGDGRPDFLQLGRGKEATVHRGRADCSFPTKPDFAIPLKEPPLDLNLVQVRDFDGDHKADLLIIQPQAGEPGVTAPVRLDLYLSGGAK
ncbi:MAG TPA: VCBS repeat-containing protein [Thermoanaerobaculia bacterium]|nr:VCBS repeat-containing protein [Thermoanaerobaculia bacterium]